MTRYTSAHLARCPRCSLVFAGQLPSEAELTKHYARYPVSEPLSLLTARRYDEILDRLDRFRETNRLLDVGCGDGHFLASARKHGWDVYGSEYGDAPLQRAQELGIDVRRAPFSPTEGELGSFDVVTAIEVLEHVAFPLDETQRITGLLRVGGCLYLTTPNFGSISRRIAGPRWRAIEYPEHLNFFTPDSLDLLLSRTPLTKLSVTTTGVSPSDIWAGIRPASARLPQADSSPCMDQRLRERIGSSPALDRSVGVVNCLMSRLAMGDTIKAFYLRR